MTTTTSLSPWRVIVALLVSTMAFILALLVLLPWLDCTARIPPPLDATACSRRWQRSCSKPSSWRGRRMARPGMGLSW